MTITSSNELSIKNDFGLIYVPKQEDVPGEDVSLSLPLYLPKTGASLR
jgi:hypothetical protein